ncbi:thioredoxin domain-containing protein [soil metagenome]
MAEATKENFRELVADGQVLVDVWGPDCASCLALMPHVEKLAGDSGGSLRVVKLEAPKARRLCMELQLMGLPAFLLFRDGAEVARINGPQITADALTAWLEQNQDPGPSGPPQEEEEVPE